MKRLIVFLLVIVLLAAVPVAVNILQNGPRKADGRTMEQILGIAPSRARVADINALSKADIMQLFYAAPAPGFYSMNGEYQAEILPKGLLAGVTGYYSHHLMGPGHWEGKAFTPAKDNEGWGYNLFSAERGGSRVIQRTLRMDTFVGPSAYDGKNSFHLVYAPYTAGSSHSMRDEIRRINPNLYLGLGYMAWSGGHYNPAPFVLTGPPEPWVGPDGDD